MSGSYPAGSWKRRTRSSGPQPGRDSLVASHDEGAAHAVPCAPEDPHQRLTRDFGRNHPTLNSEPGTCLRP